MRVGYQAVAPEGSQSRKRSRHLVAPAKHGLVAPNARLGGITEDLTASRSTHLHLPHTAGCATRVLPGDHGVVSENDLPRIGAPATRALASIGVTRLEQVAGCSRAQLSGLHGFGPRALRLLEEALAARGEALRS
jgi:hypothetical protein